MTPSIGDNDGTRQATYLEELERLAAVSVVSKESQEETQSLPPNEITFNSVDEVGVGRTFKCV